MARKYKRDLETPLAESKFDPADYNKDGEVTMKEQSIQTCRAYFS